MTHRPPPIPPDQRGKSGPDAGRGVTGKVLHGKAAQAENPDKRGQSANTRINTTQGRQHDR